MDPKLRQQVEWSQEDHEIMGFLYHRLNSVRNVIIDLALGDWRDKGWRWHDIPLLSLEAMPTTHPTGVWRGKFSATGPLGFSNVISINLCHFRTANEIPPTIAHELAHWYDRPNVGHGDSFWEIMRHRIGIDRNDMFLMPWLAMRDHFPDDLHDIPLANPVERTDL